jgi:hypothetical protein
MGDFKPPKLIDGIEAEEFLSFNFKPTRSVKVDNSGMEGVMDINKEGGNILFISTQL